MKIMDNQIISNSIKIGLVVLVATLVFSLLKKAKKLPSTTKSLAPPAQDDDSRKFFQEELLRINERFSSQYINYCTYHLMIERNLSSKIRKILFQDGHIEYGEPFIKLPREFISGDGYPVLVAWLAERGITLDEDDSISRVLANSLINDAKAKASQLVDEATAKLALDSAQGKTVNKNELPVK